jgi:hypothetical protein
MQNSSQLPLWVSYAQAISVIIFALLGALIALQQMIINSDKLRLDEFNRAYPQRDAVYKATRAILAKVYQGKIAEDDIRAYGLHTLDAKFLFDPRLVKYLKEVREHVTGVAFAESHLENEPLGETKDEYDRIRREHLDWIRLQGDDEAGFDLGFRPYLFYERAERPRWLRWLV